MSEVAEQAAGVTADVVEETIDGVIDTIEIVRNNPVALAFVGALGLAVGASAGYLVAVKKLKSHFEDLSSQEIVQAKEFYANLNKVTVDGEPLTPQEVLEQRHPEAAAEALRSYQGRDAANRAIEELVDESTTAVVGDDEDETQIRKIVEARLHSVSLVAEEPDPDNGVHPIETVETRNVFVDPAFDLDEEKKFRTKAAPYVITHDEFYAAELEYEHKSLTYYEDDDTLADERDNPIREVDKVVGDDSLVRFGHGSRDRNTVFVRNDRLKTDYEVVKSSKSFLEDVIGIPDDDDESNSLQHSAQRRAFRRGEG